MTQETRWTIVAFNHPRESRAILYKRDISDEALLASVKIAIERKANLMSIRRTHTSKVKT